MTTKPEPTGVTLPHINSTTTATIINHLGSNITTTPFPTNNKSDIVTSTLSKFCCSSESAEESSTQSNFNLSTDSTTEATLSEQVHKFQRTIWTQDEFGSYVPYDESYTAPTAILLLNLFLVIFLMIVIGVAVYPAVKKYCDSTFFLGRGVNNRYWIEDNEEVVSVLTSSLPESSFALLNSSKKNTRAAAEDDSSSACSLEILTEQVRSAPS